jgi:predicted Fe-Mo cluster-binding NifX family protein
MKVAIPAWADRVSTVFDFARLLLVLDLHRGKEISRIEIPLNENPSILRAGMLSALGVQVLICGAISQPLAALVRRSGIEIIPFVTGKIDDVLDAFVTAQLADARLLLLGCPDGDTELRKRWRRFRGRR